METDGNGVLLWNKMVTATVRPSSQAPTAPYAFPEGGGGVCFSKEWTVKVSLNVGKTSFDVTY